MKGTYFTRRVWNNAAAALGSLAATLVGHAALSYLLARALGPREYGAATLAFAVIALATELMAFGSDGFGVRAIAAGGADAADLPGRALTFRLLNAVVVMAVIGVALTMLPLSPAERVFLGILTLGMPFGALTTTVATSLLGRERFGAFALLSSVSAFVALAVAGTALQWGVSLPGIGVILVAIRAGTAAGAWFLHRRIAGPLRPAAPGPAYRSLLRPSLPFFLIGVLATLHMKSSIPLIRWLRGAEELGLFGVAATAAHAAAALVQPLSLSLFPAVARAAGASALHRRTALRTLRIPLCAGVALGLALALIARPAITLALGPEYAGSVPPLRILAGTLPLLFVSTTGLRMLMAGGHTGAALRILAVNVALNLAANLLLIPQLGIRGAAVAAVLSAAASAAQVAWFLTRRA